MSIVSNECVCTNLMMDRMHPATGLPFWRVVPAGGANISGTHFPEGSVIGINTQIYSPAGQGGGVGQSAGVGFAIPIDTARNLLPRLQAAQGGEVNAPDIGIRGGLAVLGHDEESPSRVRWVECCRAQRPGAQARACERVAVCAIAG